MLIVTLKTEIMIIVHGDNLDVNMCEGIPMLNIYRDDMLILCIHALDVKNVKDAENDVIFEAIRIDGGENG